MIERIENPERRAAIARGILEALKDWFEVDETRERYIADSRNWLFLADVEAGRATGFLCLKPTGKDTVEIAVMGVLKQHHRQGCGRRLVEAAMALAREQGYAFMQVKTVKQGVYEDYDRTNRFYQRMGFREFEVIPEIWGPENPCQIYVMALETE